MVASLLTMVVDVVVEDLALSVEARPSDPSGAPFNDASDAAPKVIDGVAPLVVTFVTPEVPFPLKCVTSVPLAILTGKPEEQE